MYLYFFRNPNRNAAVTKSANSSAAEMASQTPSMSKKMGRISTAATWKTSVRRKEMAADTPPLPRAVKKEEPKIANPEKRKETE